MKPPETLNLERSLAMSRAGLTPPNDLERAIFCYICGRLQRLVAQGFMEIESNKPEDYDERVRIGLVLAEQGFWARPSESIFALGHIFKVEHISSVLDLIFLDGLPS